jgi:hypothetical protein
MTLMADLGNALAIAAAVLTIVTLVALLVRNFYITPSNTKTDKPVKTTMQLGDDVKAIYPEQWQQDAVLKAWNTGKPVVANRPANLQTPVKEQRENDQHNDNA